MAKTKAVEYGDSSISALKGADRVRKRPAVIFGSDGIDGCQHSVFEILSNSIDEAREGYGKKITVTRFSDDTTIIAKHLASATTLVNIAKDLFANEGIQTNPTKSTIINVED